ncbi:MAG: hypothetical protein HQ517_06175 [SAR324 cluster bacterium]|nr:hypothetical protein [SAR324 cluster bacterium]
MKTNSWLVPIGIVVVIVIGIFLVTYKGQPTGNRTAEVAVSQPVVQTVAAVVPQRFTDGAMVNFNGKVESIHIIRERNDKVHIFVRDGNGNLLEVSVAPAWYLVYIKCPDLANVTIRGKGFNFDQQDGSAMIYAKKIWVDRSVCSLRNDEGFSFWSDRLR